MIMDLHKFTYLLEFLSLLTKESTWMNIVELLEPIASLRSGVCMEVETTLLWHGTLYKQQGSFWISEDGNKVMFNGYTYRWDGYYYRRGGTKGLNPHSSLHRAVWAFYKGEIPEKYHVHHKDHNPKNNSIDNLEIRHQSEHSKYHGRVSTWIGSEENIKQLRQCNERVKEWHKSEAGKLWHSQHGKQTWKTRKFASKGCVECKKTYKTPFPDRAKFCSDKCKARYHRKHYFKEWRACFICLEKFEINKYSSTKTCSKHCASQMANHTKRLRSTVEP
jgi:hypothetical protein